ncbi:hypothetical protein TL18_04865 [Methanobrevibacter sp. YE315]|uniref:hypothetical protein n=1 Tax=Methanobrevibacter sp. YE315 TaxID=1609968 RepID=UPI000764D46E|nr:hypothetical protein [Methanobrevibacter sp. YE315]AMD17408.1 hypothetical protein TL18_04865 [Methanobrevibacter sp. YE315]
MEFILNNKKYSIKNHELFINYLMVDNYFRNNFSKYEYDIRFDFVEPLLNKDKIEFEDILKGTEVLEELIEKEQINFIPQGLKLDQHRNGNFRVTYQDLEFSNLNIGETIPFLIALNSLLTYKPIIPLFQIEEELENFIGQFRKYNE